MCVIFWNVCLHPIEALKLLRNLESSKIPISLLNALSHRPLYGNLCTFAEGFGGVRLPGSSVQVRDYWATSQDPFTSVKVKAESWINRILMITYIFLLAPLAANVMMLQRVAQLIKRRSENTSSLWPCFLFYFITIIVFLFLEDAHWEQESLSDVNSVLFSSITIVCTAFKYKPLSWQYFFSTETLK